MKQRLKSFAAITLILASSLGLPLTVNAIDRATIRRYAENNILFYNPEDGVGEDVSICQNVNYAGDQVWSDAELDAVTANKKYYIEAANKYGFRWEILAVVHRLEHGLARDNPDNLQGAYQLYSYTDGGTNDNKFSPPGPISDEEFARQTDIAASVIKGKLDAIGSDGSTDDGVKKFFFSYNGMANVYIEKAKNMGFSDVEANNGEGSAYVMNRYDAQRDPNSDKMSDYWPGRYVGDGVYDETATTNEFGAFVRYKVLTGACLPSEDKDCAGDWASIYPPYTAEVSGLTYCNYKQKDPLWENVEANGRNKEGKVSLGTMGKRGCFATSTAITLTGFGADVSPLQLGYNDGFNPATVAANYGLSAVNGGSKLSSTDMAKYLYAGKALVIDEDAGWWTTQQHKIAIVDVRVVNANANDDDKYEFYVLNPSDRTDGQEKSGWKTYKLITDDMKDSYIIGKKE